MYRLRHAPVPVLAASLALLLAGPVSAATPSTERVSVSSSGEQGNQESWSPSISADGRFVAFMSFATDLVAGDTNGADDTFVRDRKRGTTELVSVSTAGEHGNGDAFPAYGPSISADGRFVAFQSRASNLVAGDTNGTYDIFVRDRSAGTTERVSVSSGGVEGDHWSGGPSITPDGRLVAFESLATSLVAGDANLTRDIFVRDRSSGTTELVSVSTAGEQANGDSGDPAISADGRFVAFTSGASNLVAGDTNGTWDIFVGDRKRGTTRRVSVSSAGRQVNGRSWSPAISADGRFVAFFSSSSNLVAHDTNPGRYDVFVRDRRKGTTERVSVSSAGRQANSQSRDPSISADGRFVAYDSWASNLVPGDTNGTWDAFVRDRKRGTTRRVSVSSAGRQGDGDAGIPSISADGRIVAFWSRATNLVAHDTNQSADVFVRGPLR